MLCLSLWLLVYLCLGSAEESYVCNPTACSPVQCPNPRTDACCPYCEDQATSSSPCNVMECPLPPTCETGWDPVVLPGGCCPQCEQSCYDEERDQYYRAGDNMPQENPCISCTCRPASEFKKTCLSLTCYEGQCPEGLELVSSPGECCRRCATPQPQLEDPCSGITCPPVPSCTNGVEPVRGSNACCLTCPNATCELGACPKIKCGSDYVPVIRTGDCCPTCCKRRTRMCEPFRRACYHRATDRYYLAGDYVPAQKDCKRCECSYTGKIRCTTYSCLSDRPEP